jgi:hypothetical protein
MAENNVVVPAVQSEAQTKEHIRWCLFDLGSDLKMLAQLLKEKEVGFPTPEDENLSPLMIIETAVEHLRYLASAVGQDDTCPPPKEMHPLYPLGEGRMSKEEYEDRRGKLPPAHVEVEEELMGLMYFDRCSAALNRGDEDGAHAIIDEAAKDNVLRRILTDYEDVMLFDDGSWFDVNLCLETQFARRTKGT